MRVRTVKAAVVLAGVMAMLGAACNSSSPGGGGSSGPGTTGTPSSAPVQGGSIVVGAEQWPECVNPITSCSSASWLFWSVLNYVMPRAMELDLEGNFIASPVLTEAPTLENGGLTPPLRRQIEVKASGDNTFVFTMPSFDPARAAERALENRP